ncbi:MAG TPA: hypothetical protein VGN76_04660 [Gemmatimonadales bacterium]|jgi:hypothetical protein|nr:hypothetical protein [Gemmatimonadales bacterium]
MVPPLSDSQWQIFREQMELIAEQNTRSQVQLNPVAVAEAMLVLMDRIDELEKRIAEDAA